MKKCDVQCVEKSSVLVILISGGILIGLTGINQIGWQKLVLNISSHGGTLIGMIGIMHLVNLQSIAVGSFTFGGILTSITGKRRHVL